MRRRGRQALRPAQIHLGAAPQDGAVRRRAGKSLDEEERYYNGLLRAFRRVGSHRDGSKCEWKKTPVALSLPYKGIRWPAVLAARCSVCGTVRTTHVTGVIRSEYDGKQRWLMHYLYQWQDGHARLCIGRIRRFRGRTASARRWS